jgi:hypothetical protein
VRVQMMQFENFVKYLMEIPVFLNQHVLETSISIFVAFFCWMVVVAVQQESRNYTTVKAETIFFHTKEDANSLDFTGWVVFACLPSALSVKKFYSFDFKKIRNFKLQSNGKDFMFDYDMDEKGLMRTCEPRGIQSLRFYIDMASVDDSRRIIRDYNSYAL